MNRQVDLETSVESEGVMFLEQSCWNVRVLTKIERAPAACACTMRRHGARMHSPTLVNGHRFAEYQIFEGENFEGSRLAPALTAGLRVRGSGGCRFANPSATN